MMEFIAKTCDAGGKRGVQKLRARDAMEAVRILTGEQLVVLDIRPTVRFFRKPSFSSRSGPQQLLFFTRQLQALIAAGVHLGNALHILAGQAKSEGWTTALQQIESDIYAGNSLAEALEHQPGFFFPLYVSLVQVGETGGVLPKVLVALTRYLEREQTLRSKLRQAILYPLVILGVAVFTILLLMLLVIPAFSAMFAEAGLTLPWITRLMIGVSSFLTRYGVYLLLLLLILALIFRFWSRNLPGKRQWHRIRFKFPVLGRAYHQAVMGRLMFSLALLIQSGIPILRALEISGSVVDNAALQEVLAETGKRIMAGDALSVPLAESGLFDSAAIHMIKVGEETGGLDQMLAGLTDFYETELQYTLTSLFTLIEPALVLVVGIIVGVVVIAALLPMFDFMAVL